MNKHTEEQKYKEFCKKLQYIGFLCRIECAQPNLDNKDYILAHIDLALKKLDRRYFIGLQRETK